MKKRRSNSKSAPLAPEMRALYEQRGLEWMDYPETVSLLREKGVEGINPLLSDAEHNEPFETVDPYRMVELATEGLSRV